MAGAVAAGASLFPGSRLIGGLAGGAAMFALAYAMTPCCDGCAGGAGCGASSPAPKAADPSPFVTNIGVPTPSNTGIVPPQPTATDPTCPGCSPDVIVDHHPMDPRFSYS
jgi:hypothetical protein